MECKENVRRKMPQRYTPLVETGNEEKNDSPKMSNIHENAITGKYLKVCKKEEKPSVIRNYKNTKYTARS